ncbi:MAG: glutamate 5-kinase, partial [Woeseiaceae bacterium]|nr:glutamate 5-kinase [Woeseiaceae bacterium]
MSGLNFSNYRRLVIKVGSSLLIDNSGELNHAWLNKLADDVADLSSNGHEILIVSSGAIAIGSSVLKINKQRAKLADLQAAAAAGQVHLVDNYQEALGRHGITVAQILLTPDDTEDRRRFLNARRTLGKLIAFSVVPIINENDTVATEEIRYGD